ncbi:MAG: metallophosphatase [Fluviicola sp.]|nr:metallophosphatase [Fluviicola sp.]
MNRRTFIHRTGIVAAGAAIAPSLISATGKKDQKLVVLHTNDTHSNIDPFPDNHGKYPGMGGVARRATLIEKIRAEEEHVLLLDSGDIFQGTPYFNKFKGVLEMKVLSEMKYDAATLGNHDFDIGLEGFKEAKQHATFPFVNANYDLSGTSLRDEVKQHVIIRKGKLNIGVFGLGVDLNGLVSNENTGALVYMDPIAKAQEQVASLRKQHCDLIICLSHLGYEYPTDPAKVCDKHLAANTEGIDLILGGHTHTFLEKPEIVKNKIGSDVVINQVGYAGLFLGRIDVFCSSDNQFEVAGTPLGVK